MNSKPIAVAILCLSHAALACSLPLAIDQSGTDTESATPAPRPPLTDPAAAIAQFDGNDPATFLELELLIAHPASHAASAEAAVREIGASDPETPFAAVYLLINTGSPLHAPALLGALADPDEGLRAIAASGLIGWGEKAALPVLIESLAADRTLPHSDPPTPIWILAQDVLPFYTGEDFGLVAATSSADAAATIESWQAWWDNRGEDLQWNAESGRYE